ncbi:type II secretion system protein [Rubrivivax sp. A210]|uniref:type II secretion system protein n=1 Tax=Rubrivivax sp. A210 TaxID=2772301 RepID=UPI001918D843|nr:prepilin-type N-terminal cleavage/methylation domain-containing protein [Rubrivivax sp. A210]
MTTSCKRRRRARGFTMIELVVVLAVLGLLLSIAVPRYLDSLERGREQVLAHNLAQLREAIDRHYGDRGAYPDRLEDLVERRYLRALPVNPYTMAADWRTVAPPRGRKGQVYDVTAVGVAPPALPDALAPAADPASPADPAASAP